ncbi:MAG: caspase family protein [Bacteroidales bacterium]|nr:caspase family protein [Bacteroidales bacterium]
MKQLSKFLTIISIITVFPLFMSSALAEKRALIIAIGDYPDSLGWSDISSRNDVALIQRTLLGQGFEERNMVMLFDKQATKKGIVDALNNLIRDAGKGDIVVIHYSGHGQQISDNNGDEIDKLDETLVAWDAPAFYTDGYTGENHLRDDEFGEMITALRQKVGSDGQVLVFMDSCHSGTGTRGEKPAVKVRGGGDPLIIPAFKDVTPSGSEGEKGFGLTEAPVATRGGGGEMAPFILFAGASFNELNYETTDDEGNGVGSLSYCIAKSFSEMEEGMTYRSVFNKVHSTMSTVAPRQTPMLEGDIDYQVFNGTIVEQEGYFIVDRIMNDNDIRMNGGKIMNLYEGDVIGVYPSGTINSQETEPLFTGKISESESFSSIVHFDNPHGIDNKLDYWLFVREQNFENRKIGVDIGKVNNARIDAQLREQLTGLSLIQISSSNPDLVVEESGSEIVVKTASDDIVFDRVSTSDNAAGDKSINIVKRFAQTKFIKELKMDNPDYRVEIRLIPVKAKFEGGKIIVKDTLDFAKYLEDEAVPTFTEKDQFLIEVVNTGNRGAYFNIIDIQPDGYINPVVPAPGKDGKEYKIARGQTYIVPDVLLDGFYEPYGTEVFKVFASKDPINLSPIINSKGVGTRGGGSPLEMILQDTFQNTRGPKVKVSNMPAESSGSTYEYIFKIGK